MGAIRLSDNALSIRAVCAMHPRSSDIISMTACDLTVKSFFRHTSIQEEDRKMRNVIYSHRPKRVKYSRSSAYIGTHPRPQMLIQGIFSVSLAVLWSVVGVSCANDKCSCTKPAIRKEWRKLSTHARAEWIRAVNVRMPNFPHTCCHARA